MHPSFLIATMTVAASTAVATVLPRQDSGGLFKRASLEDCLKIKNVPVTLSSNSSFSQLATPFNLRLSYTPAGIVIPTTVDHIKDAVVCAGQSNVKVQARGGGHSYASYSSGGQSGSLIIDLRAMHAISYDQNTAVAQVEGGVRLGNLANTLFSQWNRAMAHGTCPSVGVGGHATHGGFGPSSRRWGLTMDQIVGLDAVLANGTALHASSTENPDVYYALRGAADSIGIVTKFYFNTQPAPQQVLKYDISIPAVLSSKETAAKAVLHIQDVLRNPKFVDRNLSFRIVLGRYQFEMSGIYFGSKDNWDKKIKPELLRGLPTPQSDQAVSMSWLDLLRNLGGVGTIEVPAMGVNEHDTFFAKSIVTRESAPLTQAALESFFDYQITKGSGGDGWFVIMDLYGGPDSQINTKPTSFSAYAHRDSLWVFQLYARTYNGNLPFDNSIVPFLNDFTSSLTKAQPDGGFAAYINYLDPTLSPAEAHDLYYGAETYQRLLKIKQVVDPNMTFWNPQAIGT